jgi:isoamylase
MTDGAGPTVARDRGARLALRAGLSRDPVLSTGSPRPLGATFVGYGVNFAVFASEAEHIELCLFDETGAEEVERLRLPGRTGDVWHGFLPQAGPGLVYGYRAYGPWDPAAGLLYNPRKLLLDPYARWLAGPLRWDDSVYGYDTGQPDAAGPDDADSAPAMPRAVVSDATFDWGGDTPPRTPWEDTVIYELHVKGYTRRHPDVPEALRGTYLGLASPAVVDYLRALGVTAVELLPCQAFVTERMLHDNGLENYWGYNPIGFFAATDRYALDDPVTEFRMMVKELHRAGLEVILDVVFNHTAEGNHLGPTLSFRGLDNRAYYRLDPDDTARYLNYSGCGNTLDVGHRDVLKLVTDALRYWVQEMHVDGFRFDLAVSLGRDGDAFDAHGAFFSVLHQDPVLSRVKLIAEPWDLGHDGYQLGRFPAGWSEWNGAYRDTMRSFWRGEQHLLGDFAAAFTGSSNLFERVGRDASASINYVASHDGFTLTDLVSYSEKHNEANLEDNRDGENHNRSANYGVEGPTDDPETLQLRERQKRNLLATVFLSKGVPMLHAGDEAGRSQGGNNNAYCQDNPISWIDWEAADEASDLRRFVSALIWLRRSQQAFRSMNWFRGAADPQTGRRDVAWFRPDGEEMRAEDWRAAYARSLSILIAGDGPGADVPAGVEKDNFLLLVNAYRGDVEFRLPRPIRADVWETVFDTARDIDFRRGGYLPAGAEVLVRGSSLVLLTERLP